MQLLIVSHSTETNAKIFRERFKELLDNGGLAKLNEIYPIGFQEEVQYLTNNKDVNIVSVSRFALGYTAYLVKEMQASFGNNLIIEVYFIRFTEKLTAYEEKKLFPMMKLLSEYIHQADPTRS